MNATKKVWEDENALIDHVRTYTVQKMEQFLSGCDVAIATHDKELYVKFRRNLDRMVEELLENNQALQAWDLVRNTNWPKKDRLWLRVKHAFNPEDYKKYYSEQLVENPVPEEVALDCTKLAPRFSWLVEQIDKQNPKTVIDLGCADGYVCLTLAKKGIECSGVNLYEPSIKIAKERASKFKLPASFKVGDMMEVKDKADAIVLFEVLEHVPQPQETIDLCMSLVMKGGSFYLSTPSPEHIGIEQHKQELGRVSGDWNDGQPAGHLRIFSEEDLRELLKNYTIKQFTIDSQGCFNIEVKNND